MTEQPDRTMLFRAVEGEKLDIRQVLEQVYQALAEKGYNPLDQLVGYLMSGDPAYITNHRDARSLIKRVERDELLEALLRNYLSR
ncbi:MAG TPA: IreB family regulatory phosphoprotein [Firmicutes bacterium]|nr:IreB family regulatory phosphoprotein [Bacillota bacterium]